MPIDKAPHAPRGHSVSTGWPSFRYSPDGEAKVFNAANEVPEGWEDSPDAFKKAKDAPVKTMTIKRPAKQPWPELKGE